MNQDKKSRYGYNESGQDWLVEKQQLLKKITELEKELKTVKKVENPLSRSNNSLQPGLTFDRKTVAGKLLHNRVDSDKSKEDNKLSKLVNKVTKSKQNSEK